MHESRIFLISDDLSQSVPLFLRDRDIFLPRLFFLFSGRGKAKKTRSNSAPKLSHLTHLRHFSSGTEIFSCPPSFFYLVVEARPRKPEAIVHQNCRILPTLVPMSLQCHHTPGSSDALATLIVSMPAA